MRVSNVPYEPLMSWRNPSRKPRRVRPQDPAIWVWAAVALIALVPLQHAVASRLERVLPHHVRPAAGNEPATSTGAQPAPAGTAGHLRSEDATQPRTAAQAPTGAGIATP